MMRWIPESLRRHPRMGEWVGLVLLVTALIGAGALVSYRGDDPSLGFRAGDGETGNWFGIAGSTFAEILLQLFGVVAFAVPLGLAAIGWRRVDGCRWRR